MRRRTILLSATALGAGLWLARSLARRPKIPLRSRVVVITGGSRGLGLMLAREFGRRGARIAICGRNERALERATADLSARGIETFARRCDVRERAEVTAFIAAVRSRFGGLDVLVNNAGTIEVGPASTMTESDYADALRTHFWGPYYAVEAALPELMQAKRGCIVNVVSIGGLVAIPHLLPYSASKFALAGYSLGLRAELAAKNVAVTTVCPGLMRTGSARNAWFKGQQAAEYAWFSLGAALPLTSASATSAARRIVDATARAETLVVLTLQAQLLATVQHLFPSLTLRVLEIVARILPGEKREGNGAKRGYDSESPLSQSFLNVLARRAEAELNQR
ncbi:MAG: SDR family NAD(P)-dependent oxidoreductase [Candidatus Eremiobacteraeota bacterium]|nr:SDR family NAD(P)-dependent oxidoreductase [Candidatus Eremiobacteraeota bacterium]